MDIWTPSSPLAGLPFVKEMRTFRESSYDRSGGNADFARVEPGATFVLADIDGPGSIRHIWMTTRCYEPMYLRQLVIEMYWDGETNPSVRAPLGDLFGVGHATARHFVSLPVSMVFGNRRGPQGPFAAAMNSYFPMPFASRARIQLINECPQPVENLFYMIDFERATTEPPPDMGRFHATFNLERPCAKVVHAAEGEVRGAADLPGTNLTGDENYVILQAEGAGHYVGCVLSIDNWDVTNQRFTWPGEGDDMIFIDGDVWPPTMHGTGTEDYFLGAWATPSGEYAGPYHGISLASGLDDFYGLWSFYRFHVEDPVRFGRSIRVTIEHGHANDQGNDYSSVAYWYQHEPHRPLPSLPPVVERLPRRWPEHGLWNDR